MNDEFYIGWEAKAPPAIHSTVRKFIAGLLLGVLILATLLALVQRMIGVSVFEWGNHKTFSGILKTQPYPHLLVPRPGHIDGQPPFSIYYLVAPWKFGLKPETIAPFDGKSVTLKGTLIYRENQTMVEVQPDSLKESAARSLGANHQSSLTNLGLQTVVGEIVDSKCFLGVMNPGQLAPHRACAIRCISGGCPPVLLVRQTNSPPLYFLLVSADGKPVNKQVLGMVAEPLQITGEVVRQDDLLILKADPATYRRM